MGRAEKPLVALKAQPKVVGTVLGVTSTFLMAVRSRCFFLRSPSIQKEFLPFPQPQSVSHWHIPSRLLSSLLFLLATCVLPSDMLRREEGLCCHVKIFNFPMWRWYHGPDSVLNTRLISLPVEKQYQFCGVKGWSENNALCIVKQATSPVLYKRNKCNR